MISVGFNILDPLLIRCWAEATMDWSCGQDVQDKECIQNSCRNTYWKALTQRIEQEIQGYYQLKTSLMVCHRVLMYILHHHHQEVTRFYFYHTVGNEIPILEIFQNIQNIPSIGLPTQGMMYPQSCFTEKITLKCILGRQVVRMGGGWNLLRSCPLWTL
jgi:hypothetical protein